MKTQLIALSLGLLTVASANANLIVNGSFEDLGAGSFNGSGWNYFTSVPGWTSADNTPIEIGQASVYGVTGQDGNNVMELDSTMNVTVNQSITSDASSYTLSFLYAGRQGIATDSETFDVLWNGTIIASISPDFNSGGAAMTPYFITFNPGNGSGVLSFAGTGISDSYGALLDDVQLNATPSPTTASVPEPSTWVAGMLLILPFGVHGLRALRMRQQRA